MAAKDYLAFNPRLERLVVEVRTDWSEVAEAVPMGDRPAIARRLHGSPQACPSVRYDRMHTGFCRVITVTAADLDATP